jgi:hypothetical protein
VALEVMADLLPKVFATVTVLGYEHDTPIKEALLPRVEVSFGVK